MKEMGGNRIIWPDDRNDRNERSTLFKVSPSLLPHPLSFIARI